MDPIEQRKTAEAYIGLIGDDTRRLYKMPVDILASMKPIAPNGYHCTAAGALYALAESLNTLAQGIEAYEKGGAAV